MNNLKLKFLLKSKFQLIFKLGIIAMIPYLPIQLIAQQHPICGNELIQLKEQKETILPALSPKTALRSQTPLYIKTVVHVLYYNDTDSIPSEEFETLIDDVNRVFRGEGVDTSLVNPIHRDKLMDSNIQFCLAETDPEGNPTTGITYKQTQWERFPVDFFWGDSIDLEEVKIDSLGGVSPWDTERYFNIWIADMGLDTFFNSVHNYGVPIPSGFPLNSLYPDYPIPGIVIDLDNFINGTTFFSLENLAAHECGHYLGLVHTFSGGFNGDCTNSNDFIDDTPTCLPNGTCGVEVNSCTDSINDQLDHVSNTMDYACMQMFTPGQISMMHNNLSQASVELYDETPCGMISSIENNEAVDELKFEIFPNPNNGEFRVRFNHPFVSEGELSLFNSMGQKIFTKDISVNFSQLININNVGLRKGIYYVSYKSMQGIFSKKILIQ